MATVTWTAPAGRTTGISAASVAAAAAALGSEIDNEANKDRFCTLHVLVDPGTAPVVDTPVYIYILYDTTSSQYEDGDASTQPKKAPAAIFLCKNSNAAQRQVFENIPLAPFAFKLLAWNGSDQTADITVECETHNEAVA